MMPRAYEMALNTWSDWLEVHVNRSKTQVFFVSMSPTHERYELFHSIDAPLLVGRFVYKVIKQGNVLFCVVEPRNGMGTKVGAVAECERDLRCWLSHVPRL